MRTERALKYKCRGQPCAIPADQGENAVLSLGNRQIEGCARGPIRRDLPNAPAVIEPERLDPSLSNTPVEWMWIAESVSLRWLDRSAALPRGGHG